ncbi:helix-turn-helix domain-containing protein [Puniceicoccus vermicola]|nr:helix-turn-helix domain-containing protein [Puniceicoccus vermicola]
MASIRCIFVAEIPMKANAPCPIHSHHCTELVYYAKGSGELVQNNNHYPYRQGQITVSPPNVPHSDIPHQDGRQICVGISGCDSEDLRPNVWDNTPKTIGATFEQLLSELKGPPGDLKQRRLDLLSGWILVELQKIQREEHETSSLPHPVKTAREILDTRYHETLDLSDLAAEIYISADHLRHLFKQNLGESPLHYLIRKRLDVACELLTFTDLPVQEIAAQVGLENPYYFSRLFKKRLGKTPSEYRQEKRSS